MVKSRFFVLFFGLIVGWCVIIARATQLQILPNKRLAELERSQYRTRIDLPARRGVIFDRNGKELAVTVPSYSLYADPKEIRNQWTFDHILARRLGYSPNFIYQKIRDRSKQFVWIDRHLKKQFVASLMRLHLKGLAAIQEPDRVYPNGNLLSQVLGFVGEDGRGLSGLELQYDHLLKGKGRTVVLERDARGRPLLVNGKIFTDTPAGYDLHLTVDAELQFKLEQELEKTVRIHEADSATGVVLDAQNSNILAIATVPTFNPNRAWDAKPSLWRDRVVTDAFEPGSVVKPLIFSKAIEEGIIKPNTRTFCDNGHMLIDGHIIHEADTPFGWLTTTQILMKSSNIGAAKVAFAMGAARVREALKDFGFGKPLGVSLPGESGGFVKPLPWRKIRLADIAFGQGVEATALQIADAYAAIANGGILRTPRIVSELVNEQTGKHIKIKSHIIRRVISPEVASTMRLMLSMVTTSEGTGYNARVSGYPVAGKTGTAQVAVPGKGYVSGDYIASFVGFLPANDPRFVIYIVVNHPRDGYYGAEVAAPVFSEIASFAVQRAALPPVLLTRKSILNNSAIARDAATQAQSIARIRRMAQVLAAEEKNQTPNFTGLTLREVLNEIRGMPIHIQIHGNGVVSMTVPPAGDTLPANKRVSIYLKDL